jgi:hypothetical protein
MWQYQRTGMSRKRSRKETKEQEFAQKHTTNVELATVFMPVIIGAIGIVTNVLNNNFETASRKIKYIYYKRPVVVILCVTGFNINPLTPELNPSAQRCLMKYLTGDFAF